MDLIGKHLKKDMYLQKKKVIDDLTPIIKLNLRLTTMSVPCFCNYNDAYIIMQQSQIRQSQKQTQIVETKRE